MSTAAAETPTPGQGHPPNKPTEKPTSFKKAGARPGDSIFSVLSIGSGLLIFVTLAAIFIFLLVQSMPVIEKWNAIPMQSGTTNLFAYVGPLVFGTVLAAILALIMAAPVSIGIALFISHYAPRKLSTPIGYMIDLLAAVPSVVFGLWGGVWLVPRLEPLYRFLNESPLTKWIPIFQGDPSSPMRNILSASVVLAVMILPIITAVSREVFLQTPRLQEEAALALGATRWEMVKAVVLPFGRSGVVSASMLGLGRALGETMAVLMVMSPGLTYSLHVLEVGQHSTIASYIASQSAESTGIDMAKLIFAGLVLFVITFIINAVARAIVAASGPKK